MIKLYKLMVITVIMLTGVVLPVKTASATGEKTFFVPIIPCRLFDTRFSVPPIPGRFTGGGETRDFFIYGGGALIANQGGSAACNIPSAAIAVHLNFTIVAPAGTGFLRAWRQGEIVEPQATLVAFSGKGISNSTAIEFNNGGDADLTVKIFGSSTDLVGDVVGYYIE